MADAIPLILKDLGAGQGQIAEITAGDKIPEAYLNLAAQAAAIAARYGKDNILGIVSQAAGVPTGEIIERGSNANGEYVRWADGTQICTVSIVALRAMYQLGTFGLMHCSVVAPWPAAFVGKPVIAGTGSDSDSSGRGWISGNDSTAITLDCFYVTAMQTPALTVRTGIMAIGRWYV